VSVPSPVDVAHRALARVLRTALGDDRLGAALLDDALLDACLRALPRELDATLSFVHGHVEPRLRDRVGQRLVDALLDDLLAEIDHARLAGEPSDSRIAIATRAPPPPETQPAPPEVAIPRSPPPMELRGLATLDIDLDADLFVDPPSAIHPRARSVTHTRPIVARPSVLLVDPDRFGRATLARALVSGSCDVTVLDDALSAVKALSGSELPHVVLTEASGLEIESLLGALVARHPEIPVLVWTRLPRANVELLVQTAGVPTFEIVPKSARPADVLAALRRLVAG
jgi:CheY-like chemotaxis protein